MIISPKFLCYLPTVGRIYQYRKCRSDPDYTQGTGHISGITPVFREGLGDPALAQLTA
jgi:hypothetical protein